MGEGDKAEVSIPTVQRLETFVKEGSFKELISSGIKMHLAALKKENLPNNEEEKPDITEAIERFEDLKEKIETGLENYVVRYAKILRTGGLCVYFTRPEDLQKNDHSRLDLKDGETKQEYILTICKRTPKSEYSTDPAKVIESRGYRVEVLRQIVEKDENEYPPISFKRQSGFEITTSDTGECEGRGTKYDGITTYESRRTYRMGDYSDLTSALNKKIENLNII